MSYVTYHIPANYTDAGRLFGLFPIRNTVEAAILAVPTLFFCFRLPPFALIGLGDDSLSRFLIAWWRWKQGRKIITFRGTPPESKKRGRAV